MQPGHPFDYRQLRQIDPATARMAVIHYLESCSGNITQTARVNELKPRSMSILRICQGSWQSFQPSAYKYGALGFSSQRCNCLSIYFIN